MTAWAPAQGGGGGAVKRGLAPVESQAPATVAQAGAVANLLPLLFLLAFDLALLLLLLFHLTPLVLLLPLDLLALLQLLPLLLHLALLVLLLSLDLLALLHLLPLLLHLTLLVSLSLLLLLPLLHLSLLLDLAALFHLTLLLDRAILHGRPAVRIRPRTILLNLPRPKPLPTIHARPGAGGCAGTDGKLLRSNACSRSAQLRVSPGAGGVGITAGARDCCCTAERARAIACLNRRP